MAHYKIPNISIAVINDFQIEWTRGFGICETQTNHQLTPNTLFQAVSISKPVFALAVMRLAQQGCIDIDEDVNNPVMSLLENNNRSKILNI